MAAENIGTLIPTKIPGYSDAADIQAALRLYHYGSYSYDPNENNPANLVNPSIAHTINGLQTQINNFSGISPDIFNAKADILSATADNTPAILSAGSNGQVLTLNSSTATGLQWSTPEVTLANTATLTNKTLTAPRFANAGFIADNNGNEQIIFNTTASAVNEISVTNAATANTPRISATGGDTNISLNLASKGTGTVQANGIPIVTTTTTQELTNKTLNSSTIFYPALYLSGGIATEVNRFSYDEINLKITVGDGTTAREYASSTLITNAQTGTSYTLLLTDKDKLVELSNAAAITLTIPTNAVAAFPIGTQILILQTNTGQVTVGGSGVTINGTPGLKLRAQWSSATLIKRGTNTWVAIGDLVA